LQPFNQLALSWSGGGSMVTLTSYEGLTHPMFRGDNMAAAFYLAELLTRLLGERESVPRLFAATVWALERLSVEDWSPEVVLRSFEKLLLEELGYGVDFRCDADTGAALQEDLRYALVLERGFVAAAGEDDTCAGLDLLAIADDDYRLLSTRRAAKRIFRRLLAAQLGPKPLTSRLLLQRGTH
jgi:DNA repair protein RecO (recombination protein O)